MTSSPPHAGLDVLEAAYQTLGQLLGVLKPATGQPSTMPAHSYVQHPTRTAATRKGRCRNYIKWPAPQGLRPRAGGPFKVADLCTAYNFPTGLVGGGVIGILELSTPHSNPPAWCGYTQADLDQFSQLNGLPQIVPTDVSVNGGQNIPGGDGDGEVLLDIQVAAAVYFFCTGQLPTIKVFFAPNDDASFTAAINAAVAAGCDVLSISWGMDESGWDPGVANQVEAAAQAATDSGCVVFAASGDNSSGDAAPGANVDMPSSCPHIIGCGGTTKTAFSEVVWGDGTPNGRGTGGGYSALFPPQAYQLGAPPSPGQPGRMVPDVAADANPNTGYLIVINGQQVQIGGTSAVAPLYAGLFAAFGKKLGFVTPTLWQNPGAFVDITQGSNGSFSAAVGPDPCTGLGVPNGAALAALFGGGGMSSARRGNRRVTMPFVPFDKFLQHVASVPVEAYSQSPHAFHASDSGKAEFEAMRKHILSMYQGVKVTHSFVTADGHHVDCIPIEQQPTLRHPALKDHTIQTVPPSCPVASLPPAASQTQQPTTPITPHLAKETFDQFGNEMCCPEGTIPMRRITLEEMTRFKTLNDFFQKSPGGGQHPGQVRAAESAEDIHDGHHYATAAQTVNNIGGSSFLNVWSPTTPPHGFSLSQHWYTGGSFSDNSLQTVEGGWQVFPDLYGSDGPHLFIYWTADAYKTTGCYNLTCKAFVQTNSTWVLGGVLSPVSTTGGQQHDINMQWKRDSNTGNWWLFLQGSGTQTAIGYYPKALFGSGQLSRFATQIEYGGEVYGIPTTLQMGSGAYASAGWQKAAYQREIWYLDPTGASDWASLTGYESDPTCYTEDVHNLSGAPSWDTYFFFGGPSCG